MDCSSPSLPPFHIPGLIGEYKGTKPECAKPYGNVSRNLVARNKRVRATPGKCAKSTCSSCCMGDPCSEHNKAVRSALHMVQGEVDPNPCKGIDWNIQNRFCIEKNSACEPRLKKFNQHGYLSRLSVYESPDNLCPSACVPSRFPCKERAPSQKPFFQEYENLTDYDPFQEYPPECRHVRLPKMKYKEDSCWDQDHYLPAECMDDYIAHGFIKKPACCECLPLDPKKRDRDLLVFRKEPDPETFEMPYFTDPTNKHRWFKSGYLGHVPTLKYRVGETYAPSTKLALNRFTLNYLTPHLLEKCPVWIDPDLYCKYSKQDYFTCHCDENCGRRKTYDGHLLEEHVRHRLKPKFNPACCVPPPPPNDPIPICIQPNDNSVHCAYFK